MIRKRPLELLLAVLAVCALVPATVAPAQTDQRCFPETGQCIAGAIRVYWERNGGLAVFGFPITAQAQEAVEGQALQVQWFERDRLEIQATGAVTAGRLGVERLVQLGTPWETLPPAPDTATSGPCRLFPETRHALCPPFRAFWERNGGLERFGLPVSEQFETTLEGKQYNVQYFERRRFELHPELGADTVLLGLLGREVFDARQGQPQPPAPQPPAPPPAATPQPPVAPQPPAPSYNNCQDDPNAAAAPDYPVVIANIAKGDETVTLRNVSPDVVSLDGWIMCSIRGNQQHPISGQLAPNEAKTFPGPAGNIWNNSSSDPGALYNAQGQLISYWED